jgi:hypothetical protein
MHPPGKTLALYTAGLVVMNMLKAHVAAYKAIKALPQGGKLAVGLVHHHITFKALGPRLLTSAAE